jgi:hypothetical protein
MLTEVRFKNACLSVHGTSWPTRCLMASFSVILLNHGATTPNGPQPSHYRSCTITLRYTTRFRTPLDEWSARRRELQLENTTTMTDQLAPGGIWTRYPSKRAAPGPPLRPGGNLDQHIILFNGYNMRHAFSLRSVYFLWSILQAHVHWSHFYCLWHITLLTHTHARAHTHSHTRVRAPAHIHKHTHTQTYTYKPHLSMTASLTVINFDTHTLYHFL